MSDMGDSVAFTQSSTYLCTIVRMVTIVIQVPMNNRIKFSRKMENHLNQNARSGDQPKMIAGGPRAGRAAAITERNSGSTIDGKR